VRWLTVRAHQQGTAVHGAIQLGAAVKRLDLQLLAPIGRDHKLVAVGQLIRRLLTRGRLAFTVPIRSRALLASKGVVSVQLRALAVAPNGATQRIRRTVQLRV
jgi:hypothetical protein